MSKIRSFQRAAQKRKGKHDLSKPRQMSIAEATDLVPTLSFQTPLVLEITRVLSTPGAFMSLSNAQTLELISGLKGAIDATFSEAMKQQEATSAKP